MSTRARSASASRPKSIVVDALARVEGEGGLTVMLRGGEGQRRQAPHLRAAALLRGLPARARLPRGAGHHRADLRHLPGRLPDELHPRDGGGVRGERRAGRCAPCAASSTAGSGSSRHALHVYMLHAPDFLGYESAIHMAADHAEVVKKALELKKIGNDLVTLVGGREIHPINVKVGGFYRVPTRRELAPLAERLKRALDLSLEAVRFAALSHLPRLRAGLRVRLAPAPGRVPVQRGADRVEQGARHPGLRVRGPLHRGARRPRERPALASARGTGPTTWARSPATA